MMTLKQQLALAVNALPTLAEIDTQYSEWKEEFANRDITETQIKILKLELLILKGEEQAAHYAVKEKEMFALWEQSNFRDADFNLAELSYCVTRGRIEDSLDEARKELRKLKRKLKKLMAA